MKYPRILHYPGSKWSMADWIIEHMPEHTRYLEPIFGSGAVLFNKRPATLETVYDIDGDVVNLFKMIRKRPDELARGGYWTPYSREGYEAAYETSRDGIDRARRFLVKCGTADDSYRVKQWNDLPNKITVVADRLKEIQIENRPALQVIGRYQREDVLI